MLDPAEIKRFHLDWGPDFVETVLDSIDSLVVVLNADGRILACNRACETLTGYRLGEIQGHSPWELFVPPEEQVSVKAILQALQQGQQLPSSENHWVTRDGELRLIAWSNTLLFDDRNRVKYIVGTGIDVTARQQAEAVLRQQVAFEQLLGATARQIYNSLSLQATLNTAVTEVRQLLKTDRALILRFKPNWAGVVVESLASPQWPATLGLQIRDPQLQTQFLAQYQEGQGSAISNIAQAADCPMSWLTHFQAKAALITPILQGEILWGLLIVHQCAEPREWQSFEITFLDQLSTQLAIAIQQSELYDQLQQELNQRKRVEQVLQVAKDELEERVAERTAELKHLNEQLQRELNERQQAEANLERLSRQNELILNSMGEGLCRLNLNAEIMFVNQAATQLLGYPVDALVGKPISLVISDEPDTAPAALTPVYASLEDGSIHQANNMRFLRRDGDTFPAEYMSTPIWENNVIAGAVITFKDISQRQQIERMKDEFISVVSHELRTPLTSIHGSLRMLASGMLDKQPEKQHRLIEIAAKSTERLVRLINDVLDAERIAAGKLKVEKTVCDIAALFQQAINTMQPMADKAEIWLLSSPMAVQIWADPDRILQTLTNLLSNAIKFSDAGGPVWVTAELITPDQLPDSNALPVSDIPYVCIAVSDKGRGIHPDQLEVIFERFQQVDSSDARIYEGTGLGLSICRSIIQQHGGHIWVESQPGQGSTFFFALPQYLSRPTTPSV
ncbi:MAG: PAS domain S-box protein [Cyanobacteria bacterium P01_A01_bin.70]